MNPAGSGSGELRAGEVRALGVGAVRQHNLGVVLREVRLGAPFVFNRANIDRFNF